MSKLSNGTLSLRFMQNAHRAKQQAETQLEQAKVRDDAEWEVPKEVKEAWGIGSSSSTSSSVVHESSYLPFLFTSADISDEQPKSKGRRSFNAKGKEIETKTVEEAPDVPETMSKGGAPAPSLHPTSISGFKIPEPTTVKKKVKSATGTRTMTVQELIRGDATIRPPAILRDELDPSLGFVKPSGVDAPTARRTKASRTESGPTLKRYREGGPGDTQSAEGKKRRKKKEPTHEN